MPLSPDLGGCEHATRATLVTERSLTGSVSTTTRDTRDTCDGTTCIRLLQFPPTKVFFGILNAPVPQDSAEVCSPAFSLTAYGCLLFLAIPVWTVLIFPCQYNVSTGSKFGRQIVLDNIRADWGAEDSRKRVSASAAGAICAQDTDGRATRHLDGD